MGLLANECVRLLGDSRIGNAGQCQPVAETMYRSKAMARNVKVFPNNPKDGFEGCHWNGTVSSIPN